MIDLSQISIYNSQRVTDEQSKLLYVARTKLLSLILDSIRSTKREDPPNHQLIIGQRGMGKTTLLKRIEVELRTRPEYKGFVPLLFPEEQYNLDSLTTFWLNCIDALADVLEQEGQISLTDEIDNEVRHLSSLSVEERPRKVIMYFKHLIHNLGRRPVLLIDNLNFLFKRLSNEEHHALRSYLTEEGSAIIIGASICSIDGVYDYSAPFYDAFQIHHLKKLSGRELNEILTNLANATEQKGLKVDIRRNSSRLRAINQLTGGNPRTAVILFKQIIKGFSDDITTELEGILDAQTPYYKARFEELPDKLQLIVNAIAMQWDPVSLEQIREITQMDNGQISPQLKRLTDFGWIEKPKSARGKGGVYEISERMFNIWFLMRRSSRRQKKMVSCLSKFMEAFYEKGSEFSALLKQMMLTQFTDVKHAFTALALAKLTEDKETRWGLHEKTRKYIMDHPEFSEFFEISDLYDGVEEHASAISKAIQDKDAPAVVYYTSPIFNHGENKVAPALADALIETQQFPDAARVIDSIVEENIKYRLLIKLAVRIHNKDSYRSLALETCLRKALECKTVDSEAYFYLAKYLIENNRVNEALDLLKTANELFPKDPYLYEVTGEAYFYAGNNDTAEFYFSSPVLSSVNEDVDVYQYLGIIRCSQERYPEAIEQLSKARGTGSNSVYSWLSFALLMAGRVEDSRNLFVDAVNTVNDPAILSEVISDLLIAEKKFDKLIEYNQIVLEKWPDFANGKLRIIEGYYSQDAYEDALQYLGPYLQDNPYDAHALFIRGMIALQADENVDMAISFISQSVKIKEGGSECFMLGFLERRQGNYLLAATHIEKAVSLEPDNAFFLVSLSELYEYQLKKVTRAKEMVEEARRIDIKETPYRLVNLLRDGICDFDSASDCLKSIPEDLRMPEWESIHKILMSVHHNDWDVAKAELKTFFGRFDTENMAPDIQCYLYAKCIELGFGTSLLQFLDEVGVKESAIPEYYAVQAVLSGNPTVFFDSVAKETREIGISIAQEISFYITVK